METLTIDISPETHRCGKPYVTYYLGDVHEGAANFDDKAFRKAIDIIANDGNSWIGLGDYVDCITTSDPRFNPMEVSEKYGIRDLDDLPRIQSDHFIKNTEAIHSTCLGLISGNHENAYRKHNNFDVTKYIAKALGTKEFRNKAWISLAFGFTSDKRIPIKLVVCHGIGGGGMREGYPINKVYDTFRNDVADVHVMGHLHQMQTDRNVYNTFEYNKIRQDPSWFCVGGCFLRKSVEGNDGYFEQNPGKESSIGLLKQTIYTSTKTKTKFEINIEKIYL